VEDASIHSRLCERQTADEVGALAGSDQFAVTGTTALLDTLVAKEVAVPRRATQEFTGACLLEAFCDGFACFLHEKFGKGEDNIAFPCACKGEKREIIGKAPGTALHASQKNQCVQITTDTRLGKAGAMVVIGV
jgi:hypothetical protein